MKPTLYAALIVAGMTTGILAAPLAHADIFDMCPDGHEGVVGDHTSCAFAQNVRNGYFRFGTHFDAFSPVMGQWYEVNCDPALHPAQFSNGATVSSVDCYASSNAEVVVW